MINWSILLFATYSHVCTFLIQFVNNHQSSMQWIVLQSSEPLYSLLTVKWEIILLIFFKNLDSENHFEQSFQQSFWFIFQLVRNVRNTHWSKIALRHTPRPFIRHINRYFATHNRISLQWFIIVRFHSENARVRRILAPGHFPGLRHPKSHPPRSQLSYGFDGQTNRGIFETNQVI